MSKTIYVDSLGYPQIRNITNIPLEGYSFQKRLNPFKIPNALYFKYHNRSNQFYLNSHLELFKTHSLHHFFNTISFGNAPWITTFETSLPRWGNVSKGLAKKGIKLLAGEKCRKLIAFSECTKKIQINLMDKYPEYRESILNKLMVLHPSQEALLNSYDEKRTPNDCIIFTIVGADFFRKGGLEVLLAFDEAIEKKLPVSLNIISSLQYNDYASRAGLPQKEKAIKIIKKHQGKINYYEKLPNNEVLNLLKNTHVGLLPTYADTYGYSVLEAQSAGCPVISTNIRALPEINNNECGWTIDVRKNELGNAILNSEKDRKFFSATVQESLLKIIIEICNNADIISEKGLNSMNRIKNHHNPIKNAEILGSIYNTALCND